MHLHSDCFSIQLMPQIQLEIRKYFIQQQFKMFYGFVFFTIFIVRRAFSSIAFKSQVYSPGYRLSTDFNTNSYCFLSTAQSFTTVIESIDSSGNKEQYIYQQGLSRLNSNFQVKSMYSNLASTPSSNQFLAFNTSTVLVYFPWNGTYLTNFQTNNTNQTIKDAFFGANTSEIFILLKNNTATTYSIIYRLNNETITSKLTTINSTVSYFQGRKEASYVFFMFQTSIEIYSANSSINLLQTISFPVGSTTVSFSFDVNLLGYCANENCSIMKLFNCTFYKVDSFSMSSTVFDLQISIPYVFVSQFQNISQYDLHQKVFIQSRYQPYNFTGYKTFKLKEKYIIYYKYFPRNFLFHQIYNYDSIDYLNSQQNQCYLSYTRLYNSSGNYYYCQKNSSIALVYPEPVINTTNSPISTNTINSTNINSTASLNTLNSTVSPTTAPQQPSSQSQQNQDALSILGKTLVFASMKFNPKFLTTLSFFLDDLYYYRFHRNNYTESAQFFMDKIDIINLVKLQSSVLDFIDGFENEVFQQENAKYRRNFSAHDKNPDDCYFLAASKNVYRTYIVLISVTFLVMKLISLLFYALGRKFRCLKAVHHFLNNRTNYNYNCFISSLIEGNLAEISFYCGIQFLIFSNFGFANFFNSLATILVFFSFISYVVVFYPITFNKNRNLESEHLIVRSKREQIGCVSETACIFFRILVRGMVHSAFIANYQLQIISLIVSDVFFCATVKLFKRGFFHFSVYWCILFYNLFFLALDFLFYLQYAVLSPSGDAAFLKHQDYDLIVFVVICILIGISLVISLIVLAVGAKQVYINVRSFLGIKPNCRTAKLR